ncbi:MAG: NPXTG-anchored protein [Ruminococcus sp.]|nr:NPXTG-anchored protein [Ruminococcus sp.]
MKISKIFAGMSAAAIIASVAAAIPATAETTEIVKDTASVEINVAQNQWGPGLDATNTFWYETQEWDVIEGYGDVTVTIKASDLDSTLASGEKLALTDVGFQVYGMSTGTWNWVTGAEGTLDENGELTLSVDCTKLNPKDEAEVQFGIQAYVNTEKVALDDKASFKVDYAITSGEDEKKDENPYANITYTEKAEVTADAYAGDWGATAYTPEGWDISNIKAADGIKITYTYTLEDGKDYYLFNTFDGHGWAKLYTEGYEPEDGTIAGLPLKSAYTAEELEAEKNPVLQNDSYYIVKEPGTLTVYLTEKCVNNLLENAKDNPNVDKETGEETIWYQLGSQVYGVNITSAVYEWNNNEEVVDDSSSEESSESTSESEADSSAVDSKATDSSSKAANTAASTNPGTGAAALAAVGVALAGAAVVTSKKRK